MQRANSEQIEGEGGGGERKKSNKRPWRHDTVNKLFILFNLCCQTHIGVCLRHDLIKAVCNNRYDNTRHINTKATETKM